MKVKPDLSFWKLWNISFGFFGVQIAYALQSANISRIFYFDRSVDDAEDKDGRSDVELSLIHIFPSC